MKKATILSITIGMFVISTVCTSLAHFNTIIPDKTDLRRGRMVEFIYFWGHPYEHIVFDTRMPEALKVLTPDGKTEDIKPEKDIAVQQNIQGILPPQPAENIKKLLHGSV